MNTKIQSSITIPVEFNDSRLDVALGTLLPEYSRSKIQDWIKSGYVTVDGEILRSKDKVQTDQIVNINAITTVVTTEQPQPIDLDVIYEDQDIIIINKPPGMVVHPGAGRADNTLLNALLYHYPELSNVPRAGIIHRLDKDTSGLLVVTRNLIAHTKLVSDLQERKIKREYIAIVNGVVTSGGTVEAAIGRHPTKRTLMAIQKNGRPSTTHYRVLNRFSAHTYLKVMLETGRTHQIRVHLTHIGYPVVGDPTYGRRIRMPKKCSELLRKTLESFKRQALHARHLELKHPCTGKAMEWTAEPPKDMKNLLHLLSETS
jgi:23S rRNA pseudouridine1911/1915/1917 synthase